MPYTLADVAAYLTQVPAWFLATSVDDQPHVRPFSFAVVENDKLWFVTARGKDVYDELQLNPRFELSAWRPGSPWVIVRGTAVFAEPSPATRQAGFEHMVALGEDHTRADDGLLVFFYVSDGFAKLCEITGHEEGFAL
ncbi:MAG: pyridoxamine 5'-phosphate oxidase family protein [Coriobacteriales bacterium]|jgi:uncharacterized pyridoxamine 5'-phosphate oxidase family protein|nr:pyridoxamine 5'-phosphate oxidase family protein [Coriobacteriales bacterium]